MTSIVVQDLDFWQDRKNGHNDFADARSESTHTNDHTQDAQTPNPTNPTVVWWMDVGKYTSYTRMF